MARCPLCESDVPDGRTDCDACGQPFAKPPTTRVAPDAVRKAIESARKDLAVSPRDPVDVAFPRGLLERAEQTEAAGDLGRALDLARASRRALDIIRRESRVANALKYADAVLEDAKQAGIETLAFQRNIEQARALAARGDHGTAERLLRRVSVRTLDQRRERILAASVEKAESRVRHALERGGNVGDAAALLADARKALALKEYNKVRSLSAKAIEKADSQRKYARAETILDRASADVDASRRDGVNITEARKLLTQAQDALRKGVYADIPLLAQKARNSLREGRPRRGPGGVPPEDRAGGVRKPPARRGGHPHDGRRGHELRRDARRARQGDRRERPSDGAAARVAGPAPGGVDAGDALPHDHGEVVADHPGERDPRPGSGS